MLVEFCPSWNHPVMFGPNITGQVQSGSGPSFGAWVGAFYDDGSRGWNGDNIHGQSGHGFHFSAANSSGVFGGSSTVQPSAMASLILIKF